MNKSQKEEILKLLKKFKVQPGAYWSSETIKHLLNSAPTVIEELKPLIPRIEYLELKEAHRNHNTLGTSREWWEIVNKMIDQYANE